MNIVSFTKQFVVTQNYYCKCTLRLRAVSLSATSGSTRASRFNAVGDVRARSLVRFFRLSLSGKRDCS